MDESSIVFGSVERNRTKYANLSDEIFAFAETGFEERRSAAALAAALEAEGFSIRHGIAGMETAFEASYGSGGTAIAILGEYDALPGL